MKSKLETSMLNWIEKEKQRKKIKFVAGQSYLTFGAVRKSGLFFLDLDSLDFDIYQTKDGIHLVAKTKHKFYYHGRRIRVSPKWDSKGKIVNPAPKLIYCHCQTKKHVDKRMKCKVQGYVTRSS